VSSSDAVSSLGQRELGRRGFLKTAGSVTAGAILYSNVGGMVSAEAASAAVATLSQAEFFDRNGSWIVKPFGLDQVTLLDGTLFTEKRDRILNLAATYSADRVLHNFRVTAGLPTPPGSTPPGGWDTATGNLRGHYSGHLITLFSQGYASTKAAIYKDKVDYIVAELGKCQEALAASGEYSHPGFLAAYPETQFVRLESFATYPTIWAPYYTCHKIMRGLLDAYLLVGNQQALDIVSKMGDWVHSRLSVLPRATLNRMWTIYIAGEYGAMNEVMADLHAITGKPEYLVTAKCFDNRLSLFDAIVNDQDVITRLHANQHVPQFLGYLRVFDRSNEPDYYTAAENFWHMVVGHRMYSHGGTSGTWPASPGLAANTNPELFQPRDNIANSIAGDGAETCTSYNMLKLTRNLFFHDPDPKYMDYYERTLLNHILGTKGDIDSTSDPMVTYFVPLSPGNKREYDNIGTCDGGTGVENHTKYQESIYFRSADSSALYVNIYVASVLNWADRGFTVTQRTDYPRESGSQLTIDGRGPLAIKLRVPSWAKDCNIQINGAAYDVAATPGTYVTVSRVWSPGDTIDVSIPFRLRIEKAIDRADTQSIFHGPILLPALSDERTYLQFSFYKDFKLDGEFSHAITPSGAANFTTNGYTLRPLYVGDAQRHHIYYRRYEPVVVFGRQDSGVPNVDQGDGVTFLDAVWEAAPFKNQGQFMSTVAKLSTDWVKRGLFTRTQRTAIVEAAANAKEDLAS